MPSTDELKRLIRSTTCADLGEAVRIIQQHILDAETRGDEVVAQRWADALEDLWPRYSEAAEFVAYWATVWEMTADGD